MKNFDFEIAGIFAIVFAVIGSIIFAISLDRPIRRYQLSSNGMGEVQIRVDIQNFPDDHIPLDRAITLAEAAALVDSLNRTIR